MSEFDLDREVERYCNRISAGITSAKRKREVKNEYADFVYENIHRLMLEGESEEKAFFETVKSIGDEDKIIEMLSSVNRNIMSSVIKNVLIVLLLIFGLSTYFWVNNSSFKSYYILTVQIALFVCVAVLVYFIYRYIRAVAIRCSFIRRIKRFAKENNYKISRKTNTILSLFKVTDTPELLVENSDTAFVIKFWSTVRGKKTLRLMSNGLYSYSNNIGYMNLLTNPKGHILTGGAVFCPPNIKYYQKFSNTHSEMVEVIKGVHLMPDIKWGKLEKADKNNMRILLLNPIPFGVVRIENGVERRHTDGDSFCGVNVYSAMGFLSYLRGESIK